MSEETPFKSLKITLSDEALDKLSKLRFTACMRSDSATIEECIRTFYDIVMDFYFALDTAAQDSLRTNASVIREFTKDEQNKILEKVALRTARFIPASDAIKRILERQSIK